MIEKFLAITNNPYVFEKLSNYEILYKEESTLSVLIRARDMVHLGHVLLTHPLLSSIKPNETLYRTILLTKNKREKVDINSLLIIEESIETTGKFLKDYKVPNWNRELREDFMYIDCDLISNVIENEEDNYGTYL